MAEQWPTEHEGFDDVPDDFFERGVVRLANAVLFHSIRNYLDLATGHPLNYLQKSKQIPDCTLFIFEANFLFSDSCFHAALGLTPETLGQHLPKRMPEWDSLRDELCVHLPGNGKPKLLSEENGGNKEDVES